MASQLFEQLRTDLSIAMKDRDQLKTSTIRMVLSAVQVASVAGDEAAELTDAEIMAVLRSEAKRRNEAAELYENAGRAEQAASERNELAVIEAYLPAAMDDATLQGIVDEEIAVAREAGAEGQKAMGQVIKAVKDRVGDGADGGRIAGVVKASLA